MKRRVSTYLALAAALLGGTACGDYLDIVPEGNATMDNAFSNRINSFKFLHTCYSYLPSWDNGGALGFLAADEHWLMPPGTGSIESRIGINGWRIGRGEQNSSAPYFNYWDGANGGTDIFVALRKCNIFLENIGNVPDVEQMERTRWIAEVQFLKAYYHYFLLSLYGAIPIVDVNIPEDSDIDEVRVYREPFDQVVDYVAALLDTAAVSLPDEVAAPAEEQGRATKAMAKAVKAQLLLLAASPLFNGNADLYNTRDNRGRNLFPTELDNAKWTRAAQACREAIEVAHAAGHALHTMANLPQTVHEPTKVLLDIRGAVTEKWNNEVIWGSTYNSNGLQTQAMAKHSRGGYWGARSVLGVTLSTVETFYSDNGVPIDEDNGQFWSRNYANRYQYAAVADTGSNKHYFRIGEETALLHMHREPRFYTSVAFDRGSWYGEGYADDEQTGLAFYRFRAREVSGRNTSEDHSVTGYLNKKVCSFRTALTNTALTHSRYAFPVIRLADLYLMYAEALNESLEAPTADVYYYVDLVRARAGLQGVEQSWASFSTNPSKPATKAGMREIIRTERLNELAGEGRRFWDLRRWKQPLPRVVRGWNIAGATAEEFYRVTTLYTRPRFDNREFLWPIRLYALLRNPNLVQNPGW